MSSIHRIFLVISFSLSAGAWAVPLAAGKVVLPAKNAAAAKGIRTIFISVYQASKTGGQGMPYGAIKIDLAKDAKTGEVTPFALDTDTMMMMTAQEKLPAKIDIKVKLDKDGSAGPDAPGDIIGWVHQVKPGSKNLVVKLDKAVR